MPRADEKPARIYHIDMHNPDGRSMRQYTGRSGTKYYSLHQARAKQESLWKQHQIISTIYAAKLNWVELPDPDGLYD